MQVGGKGNTVSVAQSHWCCGCDESFSDRKSAGVLFFLHEKFKPLWQQVVGCKVSKIFLTPQKVAGKLAAMQTVSVAKSHWRCGCEKSFGVPKSAGVLVFLHEKCKPLWQQVVGCKVSKIFLTQQKVAGNNSTATNFLTNQNLLLPAWQEQSFSQVLAFCRPQAEELWQKNK